MVSEFNGVLKEGSEYERSSRFTITVDHPDAPSRVFSGLLQDINWEFQEGPCFYVGNQQGGTIYEVEEPNDSVIEGSYEDYRVGSPFETAFTFNRFEESRCLDVSTP